MPTANLNVKNIVHLWHGKLFDTKQPHDMDSRFYGTPTLQVYASLWNKYRPAIIQLMMASEGGPQSYKLSAHEFRALNPKEKTYSFQLQAFQGKAVNSVKGSAVAQDLLSVLNSSKKAMELMETITFDFSLNKSFMLEISRAQ